MSVKITIKGSQETSEYAEAKKLKKTFEEYFNQNDNGEIIIIPSATLYGQEIKDIDLIVIGKLKSHLIRNIHTKIYDTTLREPIIIKESKNIFVNNFCYVFEIKSHRAESITKEGLTLFVKYDNKKKDVTSQSEKQKYSLKSYLEENTGKSPFISNFIWFKNVSYESLDYLTENNLNNYLPSSFKIIDLFKKAFLQNFPRCSKDENGMYKSFASYDSYFLKNDDIDLENQVKVFDIFLENRKGMGSLTRDKIERLNRKLFKNQNYAEDLGKKLIIFSGKAGTGKTTKLLNAAFDLALNHQKRCLILTYNHALVSDIRRIIALQGIPDGIDSHTVKISTLHKFFKDVLEGFNIGTKPNEAGDVELDNYLDDEIYYKLLNELVDFIDEGLIDEEEITNLMKSNYDTIDFEYLLVDECQDWDEREKVVLYKLFGQHNIILAEGSDQLIRTKLNCNWTYGMRPRRDFNKTYENKSLRQKKSIVWFINKYAEKVGLNWLLEPKEEMNGGRIIIKIGDYTNELHNELLADLYKNNNVPYDMLFFTPPNNVTKHKNDKGYTYSHFNKIEEFNMLGAKLWDGTSYQFRSKSQYPIDTNQHRIFQYDSCRGLEGWSVICLDFDEFIRYKLETYKEEKNENELALETFEQKRDRFIYLWSLIPLTRPIDTLVITLKNKNSFIYDVMKNIYKENEEIISWLE
ncbi:hypothetical protein HNP24_003994 [Chryseobacterium sediminis]|uniref:AAA family ATPase n=1 Tax=Chryseobacterium sediminis TaxID=1679494 RepID=A0ABR6Q4V1_9FLAO|nr:AAA family ATPase [Chryseobacterium sediminis]MBB6332991.1 hypothetical protein [Chryseobacterium sediminis]